MAASATVGSLHVALSADTAEFVRSLQNASGEVKSLFGDMVWADIAADALKSAASAALDLGKQIFQLAGSAEQSKIAFTTMLGSAEKAEAFLQELAKFAADTPFEMKGLEDASRKLLAFGFESKNIIPIMTSVGNAVSGLGGGAEQINRVTMALGQMQAKGKVSGEEMMQLAEMGIPAWDLLAKKLGVSIPEAMKMAEKGMIPAAKGIEALVNGMNERFPNMMEKQSKTLLGAWSNLQDGITQTLTNIGLDILKTFDITGAVAVLGRGTSMLANTIKSAGIGGLFDSIFGPEMKAAVLGIGTAITVAVAPALASMAVAAWSAATAMAVAAGEAVIAWAPFIALAAAIAFAARPIIEYWDDLAFEFGQIWNAISEGARWLYENVRRAFEAIGGAAGSVGKFIMDKFAPLWNLLPDGAKAALNQTGATLGKLPGLVLEPFKVAGKGIGEFAGLTLGPWVESMGGAFKAAQKLIKDLTGSTPVDFEKMAKATQLSLKDVGTNVGKMSEDAKKRVEALANALTDMPYKLQAISDKSKVFGETFTDNAKKADQYKNVIEGLIDKGLRPMDPVIQNLTASFKKLQAAAKADEIAKTLSDLKTKLSGIDTQAKVFGSGFDATGAKVSALRGTIEDLIAKGLDPQDKRLAGLIVQFERYSAAADAAKVQTFNLDGAMEDVWKQLDEADRMAKALGKSYDFNAEASKILSAAMEKLVKEHKEGTDEFKALKQALENIKPPQDALTASVNAFKQSTTDTLAAVNGLKEGLTTIGQTLGLDVGAGFFGAAAQAGNFALALIQVGASVQSLWSSFSPVLTSLWSLVTSQLLPGLGMLWTTITTQLVPGFVGFLTTVSTQALPTLTALWTTVTTEVIPGVVAMATTLVTTVIPALYEQAVAAMASLGPYGLIAAAVVALGAGVVWLVSTFEGVKPVLDVITSAMGPFGLGLRALSELTVVLKGNLQTFAEGAQKVFKNVSNAVKGFVNFFIDGLNKMIDGINAMSGVIGVSLPHVSRLTLELEGTVSQTNNLTTALQTTSKAVAEVIQKTADLRKGLESGLSSAFTSSIKGFIDGTASLTDGLRDGVRNAIINGITDAVTQGAILKGALGGLLDELSSGLANGRDVSGVISRIGSAIPGIASQLEGQLAPLKDILNRALPAASKGTSGASSASDDLVKQYAEFAKTQSGAARWDFDTWKKQMGLAKGGLATGATMALIGEGTDEEAVLPLNRSVFGEIASGIVGAMPAPAYAGGGGLTLVVNYTGTGSRDDVDEFMERVVKAARAKGIKL